MLHIKKTCFGWEWAHGDILVLKSPINYVIIANDSQIQLALIFGKLCHAGR